jgi:16S rRNA (guanine(966)-N(2))-methyltransferase RsmD
MRIVAGIARGRRLRAPKGRMVRPTADRVKEAVFSILESRGACAGAEVLDLFAGTGALGIEALSRGAARVTFVEPDHAAATVVRANLRAAGFAGELLTMPAARAIATLSGHGRSFGGVFIDPPYDRGWIGPTLALLEGASLVVPGGWIVVEHGRSEEPPARVGSLKRHDTRRYGDARVALFVVEAAGMADHAGA